MAVFIDRVNDYLKLNENVCHMRIEHGVVNADQAHQELDIGFTKKKQTNK